MRIFSTAINIMYLLKSTQMMGCGGTSYFMHNRQRLFQFPNQDLHSVFKLSAAHKPTYHAEKITRTFSYQSIIIRKPFDPIMRSRYPFVTSQFKIVTYPSSSVHSGCRPQQAQLGKKPKVWLPNDIVTPVRDESDIAEIQKPEQNRKTIWCNLFFFFCN